MHPKKTLTFRTFFSTGMILKSGEVTREIRLKFTRKGFFRFFFYCHDNDLVYVVSITA